MHYFKALKPAAKLSVFEGNSSVDRFSGLRPSRCLRLVWPPQWNPDERYRWQVDAHSSLEQLLRPSVINTLDNGFTTAKLGDGFFITKAIKQNADVFFCRNSVGEELVEKIRALLNVGSVHDFIEGLVATRHPFFLPAVFVGSGSLIHKTG
jgi:hypothetical protein